RRALRRYRAQARPCLEIRRPARSRPDHGTLDGACRPRAACRHRRHRCGAAALAAAMGAAGPPIRAAWPDPRQSARPGRSASGGKATPKQVGLDKSERAENVQGAFRVPAHGRAEVAGRRLVLVDDVLTSGATVDACSRALLRAGAASVDVLVFARVVAASRPPI